MLKRYFFLVLLFSIGISYAQDTFVKKYTRYVIKEDDKIGEWSDTDLTVVFNEKGTNNILFYFPKKTVTFYKIGKIEIGKTDENEPYQLINCIDDEGNKITLQLFDEDGTLRMLMSNWYIEFHK